MRILRYFGLSIVFLIIAGCSHSVTSGGGPVYSMQRIDDSASDWPERNMETSFYKNCIFSDASKIKEVFPDLYESVSHIEANSLCNLAQEIAGGGVADFNADGFLDILVTHPTLENISIWLGDGALNFSRDTRISSLGDTMDYSGAGLGDFDNDGDVDIFASSMYGPKAHLLINDGTGIFEDEATLRGASMYNGNPHYGTSVTVFDYNNDGWLDVYSGEWRPLESAPYSNVSHSRLLENQGYLGKPGHFVDVTLKAGVDMTRRDGAIMVWQAGIFAADGYKPNDLVILSDFGTSGAFKKTNQNTYEQLDTRSSVAQDVAAMGLSVGDVTGDGSLEVFSSAISSNKSCRCTSSNGCLAMVSYLTDNSLALVSGNRLFSYREGKVVDITDEAGVRNSGWSWGTSMTDVDNDGDLDIMVTAGVEGRVMERFIDESGALLDSGDDSVGGSIRKCLTDTSFVLWINDGFGHFKDGTDLAKITPRGLPKSVLAADFNSDGIDEVLVFRNRGNPYLYSNVNVGIPKGLTIKFEDTRKTVGARVTIQVEQDSRPIVRVLGTQNSMYSTYYGTYVIGVGSARTLHSVTVEMPGTDEPVVFYNVPTSLLVVS